MKSLVLLYIVKISEVTKPFYYNMFLFAGMLARKFGLIDSLALGQYSSVFISATVDQDFKNSKKNVIYVSTKYFRQ